jgi:hypothetical protein
MGGAYANSSVSIAVYIHPYKILSVEILSLFCLHIAINSYRNELNKSVVITATGSVYVSVGDADPQASR